MGLLLGMLFFGAPVLLALGGAAVVFRRTGSTAWAILVFVVVWFMYVIALRLLLLA